MRRFTQTFAVILISLLLGACLMADEALPKGLHLLSTTASERATEGMGNPLVTLGDKVHVVWQDVNAKGYWAKVRSYDRVTHLWTDAVTLGRGVDNHARPCITADSEGVLHVIIGGHNTPYQYCHSLKPNDSSAWSKPVAFDAGTYPSLVCGPENTLYLAGRPRHQNGVDIFRKTVGGDWELVKGSVILREPQYRKAYGGYNAILAVGAGGKRLHFAADVYEGHGTYTRRGENQAVVYIVSDDYGKTWRKTDGTLIAGEPYPKDLDVIALNCRKREQDMPGPVLRLGGLVVDAQDRPYLLYTQHEPIIGQALVVTPDENGKWRELGLDAALRAQVPGYGALGPRGGFSITADGTLHLCLRVAPLADFGEPGALKVALDRVKQYWCSTADQGKTWVFKEPAPGMPTGEQFGHNLEKPTGILAPPAGRTPAMVFYQGLNRYAKPGEVIQNKVYFLEGE
jgi:hypothetical protein